MVCGYESYSTMVEEDRIKSICGRSVAEVFYESGRCGKNCILGEERACFM